MFGIYSKKLVFSLGFIVLFAGDQFTKSGFDFTGHRNLGISFGWGSDVSATIILIFQVICLWAIWWSRHKFSPGWAVWLILIGGLSNLLDRILLGGIRDWLRLGRLVNNLADIYIFLGLIFIIVYAIRKHQSTVR